MVKAASMLLLGLAAILAAGACASPGGASPSGEGFAIYLPAQDIEPSQAQAASHFNLPDTPLLSQADVVAYTRETHEIELTPRAYQRLQELKVPTNGRVFVVCVDRKQVYWGSFWATYSSASFSGVAIWTPLTPDGKTIRLRTGYPSDSFAAGEDPRPDARIMESLQRAGKLRQAR